MSSASREGTNPRNPPTKARAGRRAERPGAPTRVARRLTIGADALYEIHGTGDLIPFRRLQGDKLYEREIEDLFWANAEEFIGETLFLVARQPTLPSGGRPDIVALDKDARVVIVEIKRDVDRGQLAQCLEYAGWGRSTNLDELSSLYQRQPERDSFADWQEFTGGTLNVINPSPRLVLVARDFHGRTGAALEFLMDGRLPLDVVKVSIYEDEQNRRFLDIEGEREPEPLATGQDASVDQADHTKIVRPPHQDE